MGERVETVLEHADETLERPVEVFGKRVYELSLRHDSLSSLARILPSSPTPQGFPLWSAVTFAVSWAFLTLAIALVYRILPDAKIAWRDVWVGAGSSGLLFLLGNHLIGWYLAVAGITSVYGAAGSIVTGGGTPARLTCPLQVV